MNELPDIEIKRTCTGCGACVEECPSLVFELRKNTAVPVYSSNCIRCGHCLAVCPVDAVIHNKLVPSEFVPISKGCFVPPMNMHGFLRKRRSVGAFKETQVHEYMLRQIVDIARYGPSSNNLQSYYFRFVRDKKVLATLAAVRGSSSTPLGKAPLAVAICSDPAVSAGYSQDGCIAAYHFMLAAWNFGLGTCWIGAMDRKEVKELLSIPEEHHITTVTPLGYPAQEFIAAPERKSAGQFVR